MSDVPQILGPDAKPLAMSNSVNHMGKPVFKKPGGKGKCAASVQPMMPPRRGAPDKEWNDFTREEMSARSYELYRGNEIAYGATDQFVDAALGPHFRLRPEPCGELLPFDRKDLRQFTKSIKALWKIDDQSSRRWFDVRGRKSFTQIIALHLRQFRIFGEAFTYLYQLEVPDARPFRCAAGAIDVAKIGTPRRYENDDDVRSGIRFTNLGYAREAYMFKKHPGGDAKDPLGTLGGTADDDFETLPFRTPLGREQLIHSYVEDIPGLTRGIPVFVSALKRLAALGEWQEHTVNAAAWQASVFATLESDLVEGDPVFHINDEGQQVAMEANDHHMENRAEWAQLNDWKIGQSQLAQLWAGDKLKLQSPGQPIATYGDFERSMLKHFARALGTSYELLAQDWEKTNFSGARAGVVAAWRRIEVERCNIGEHLAKAIYCCWLEDNIATGRLTVPGYPDPDDAWLFYLANKDALTVSSWFGPVKDEIDRAKTAGFYKQLYAMGKVTCDLVANNLLDMTGEELIDQQVEEDLYRRERIAEAKSIAPDLYDNDDDETEENQSTGVTA